MHLRILDGDSEKLIMLGDLIKLYDKLCDYTSMNEKNLT